MKLVTIYRAANEIEASIVKGLLEEHGIKALVDVDFSRRGSTGASSAIVAVFEDRVAEAKVVLAERETGGFAIE